MNNVVDLEKERGRRDQPDTDHLAYDGDGRPMYRYACDYRMEDGEYGEVDLWAYDFEHAEATVAAMRKSLALIGQVMARDEA